MRKIIASLLFLILLITSGCTKSETYIKQRIEKANYCNTKEDCILAGSKCPFGCYVYVNKNKANEIKNLVNSFNSRCIYTCVQCQDVACVDNKCEPICN